MLIEPPAVCVRGLRCLNAPAAGRVLIMGDGPIGLLTLLLMRRADVSELVVVGSNASAEAWPEAVRLATTGGLPLERLLTHQFPAAEFKTAMAVVRDTRSAVKVILRWDEVSGIEDR